MKKERGITLVALIITIIILIILSIVTIGTLRSGNLLDLAKGAADSYQLGEVEERFVIPQATVTAEAGQEGREPTMDEYIDELVEKGVIDPDETVDNEDGSKEVVTPDGWVARVIPTEEDKSKVDHVEIEGKAEDLTVKIIKLQLTATTKSIKADITVKRGEGATYAYYYKEGTVTEAGEYKEAVKGIEDLSYTIDGLDQDKIYTIKVVATNENGTSEKYAEARTKTVNYQEGELSLGNPTWNNGKASVVVTKTSQDDFTIVYDVYDAEGKIVGNRQNVAVGSGETIGDLELGYTVKVRLTDGHNYSGTTVSLTITDIDNPIEFTPGITNIQPTSFTIDASSAKDNESGIAYYNYYIDGQLVLGNSTSATYNATNQKDGMTHKVYVEAVDKAGNVRKSADADAVLPLANVAPVIQSVSIGAKTPSSLTIRANATDADSTDKTALTFKVYIGTETTPRVTKENQTQGTNVDLQITGLSNYTEYTYHVEVTDTANHTVKSANDTGRTQCSGTTKSCSNYKASWYCSGGDPGTYCSGGTAAYTCPGGSEGKYCSGGTPAETCPGGVFKAGSALCPFCNGAGCTWCCWTGHQGSKGACEHGYFDPHTVTEAKACEHGSYSSHYYGGYTCEHGQTSSHRVAATRCTHGYTSSHWEGAWSCSHGYEYGHTVPAEACEHGYTNTHKYCEHNYAGVAHD